jgi:hypothetical protein
MVVDVKNGTIDELIRDAYVEVRYMPVNRILSIAWHGTVHLYRGDQIVGGRLMIKVEYVNDVLDSIKFTIQYGLYLPKHVLIYFGNDSPGLVTHLVPSIFNTTYMVKNPTGFTQLVKAILPMSQQLCRVFSGRDCLQTPNAKVISISIGGVYGG